MTGETVVAALRPPSQGARVHAMPCTIHHDGPAAVKCYFRPTPVAKEDPATSSSATAGSEGGELEAQFRGFELRGVKMAVPKGVVGLMVREAPPPQDLAKQHQCNKLWSVESQFREVVLWEHDNPPSKDNPIRKVQEWYQIAQAIHDDEEDN